MSKNIYIDIDETICTTQGLHCTTQGLHCTTQGLHCTTQGLDYSKAKPRFERIKMANKLYDQGHHITYWTARGTKTGIDWRKITENQLLEWGAKHHQLKMGKPAFDLFIDDKVLNSEKWTEKSVTDFFAK